MCLRAVVWSGRIVHTTAECKWSIFKALEASKIGYQPRNNVSWVPQMVPYLQIPKKKERGRSQRISRCKLRRLRRVGYE